MEFNNLLYTIATSTIVSGIVTYTLRTIIEKNINHKYEVEIENLKSKHIIEIEKLKADLTIRTGTESEIITRRFKIYPGFVELIYRIKNITREIENNISITDIPIIKELDERIKELEEKLYMHRLDLERDELFNSVHSFKNRAINYYLKALDLYNLIERSDSSLSEIPDNELSQLFIEIEKDHNKIIKKFSTYVEVKQNVTKKP